MERKYHFTLQPSETAIFRAAADIYAGYIAAGALTSDNSAELMKKSITAAISIARSVEKIIQSDDELPS